MAQIAFLHREVERLEQEVSTSRGKSLAEMQALTKRYDDALAQKSREVDELRRTTSLRSDAADLAKRCSQLEKQLAVVNAENGVVCGERADLQGKVRKMQALLKAKKQDLTDAQRSTEDMTAERSSTITALKLTIENLSHERDRLAAALAERPREKQVMRRESATECERACEMVGTQTSVAERLSQECQVCTASCELKSGLEGVDRPHSLAALLEEKTRECDELRGSLEDLSAAHRDSLTMLELTRKQLTTETERRRVAANDVENLSVQVRALQQRCSDQAAAERSLGEKIRALGEERQRNLAEKTRVERERDSWEEQLRQYEADVAQLSATKNHSSRQLSSLANENENLRAEMQQLCEREAQALYSVKAKDMEVQEILTAYQRAVHENESLLENQRFLEREVDNVRAALAAKEESVAYLQEQLRSLHLREQQLALDLQSFEYENENLHQRLARADHATSESEAKGVELQQLLHAKELSIEELHQSLSELSKQVIVKDNEMLLLRQRCDAVSADVAFLRASLSNERAKVQELEAVNARLVAREVLSLDDAADRQAQAQALEDERATLRAVLDENDRVAASCDRLREINSALDAKVVALEKAVQEAVGAKERLHRIVLEQNKALSHLAESET